MPSRGGTLGRSKEHVCLGLQKMCNTVVCLSSNHTPSPGAELRQGEGLRGPVQGRRECETVRRKLDEKEEGENVKCNLFI